MNAKKIIIYLSFLAAFSALGYAFVTSTSFMELYVASAIYLLLAILALFLIPGWKKNSINVPVQSGVSALEEEETKKEMVGISDLDKRMFLQLIGGTGIFLFIFSLFNKNAEALFFKNAPQSTTPGQTSLEDISGKKIDPAQNQPLDGYTIADIDNNVVSYYGFLKHDGAWYVMKVDSESGSFRYVKGDADFPGNWNTRFDLKYDYYSNVF